MVVEKFIANQKLKVSRLITDKLPQVSYGAVQKLLRKKDIRVNGLKISSDVVVNEGDEIVLYLSTELKKQYYEIIYQDDNVLVVNKKRGIEVISEDENNLVNLIKNDQKIELYAVHRLDRNTEGIVIFAKSNDVKVELEKGFKNHMFEKFYLAYVYGVMEKPYEELIAYLKKDNKKSYVKISDVKLSGYNEIRTNYKVVKQFEDSAILELQILTGRTHQIRAHLAHIGLYLFARDGFPYFGVRQFLLCNVLQNLAVAFLFHKLCNIHINEMLGALAALHLPQCLQRFFAKLSCHDLSSVFVHLFLLPL